MPWAPIEGLLRGFRSGGNVPFQNDGAWLQDSMRRRSDHTHLFATPQLIPTLIDAWLRERALAAQAMLALSSMEDKRPREISGVMK